MEAPWVGSWIASLIDKLYLSLRKTHPAFLVISTWFGQWLSPLAAALRSATDAFSGRTRNNGNGVLEKNCNLAPIQELPEYDSEKNPN